MDLEKIVNHLMDENEYLRHKLNNYEDELESLKQQLEIARGKGRSKVIRKKALKRDGYECVECGGEKNLNAHHILPISEGGKDILSNVKTLCIDCHIKAHKGESSGAFLIGLKESL